MSTGRRREATGSVIETVVATGNVAPTGRSSEVVLACASEQQDERRNGDRDDLQPELERLDDRDALHPAGRMLAVTTTPRMTTPTQYGAPTTTCSVMPAPLSWGSR